MISLERTLFNIGDPAAIAQTYLDVAYTQGPEDEERSTKPIPEMTELELRDTLTYRYMALRYAGLDTQDEAVLSILIDLYDEAFLALVESCEAFRQAVIKGRVQFPLGSKTRKKYYLLAGGSR